MLFTTNVVPVGTVSFTIAVVGAVPLLLSNVIVYVIGSPAFTSVPACGSDSFQNFKSDLFTVLFTGPTASPSTYAVLLNCFVRESPSNVFTVTVNDIVVCPCFGTFTVIPSFKLSEV